MQLLNKAGSGEATENKDKQNDLNFLRNRIHRQICFQ